MPVHYIKTKCSLNQNRVIKFDYTAVCGNFDPNTEI